MLVHLRNKENKLFYAGHGRWTMGPPATLRFSSISEAMLYSRQERLRDMEVVLLHSDSYHKVVYPSDLPPWSRNTAITVCRAPGRPERFEPNRFPRAGTRVFRRTMDVAWVEFRGE